MVVSVYDWFKVGTQVKTRTLGAPGEVRSTFLTRWGKLRYAVEFDDNTIGIYEHQDLEAA